MHLRRITLERRFYKGRLRCLALCGNERFLSEPETQRGFLDLCKYGKTIQLKRENISLSRYIIPCLYSPGQVSYMRNTHIYHMHVFPSRFCGLPKGVWETAVFSPQVQTASNTSRLWGRPGGAAGQGYGSLPPDSIPQSLRAICAAALRAPRLRAGFSSHGQTAGGAPIRLIFIGIERHRERGSL